MTTNPGLGHTAAELLRMEPEEIGRLLLRTKTVPSEGFQPANLAYNLARDLEDEERRQKQRPGHYEQRDEGRINEIAKALMEGFEWLRLQIFICPEPDRASGQNNRFFVTRRGKRELQESDNPTQG